MASHAMFTRAALKFRRENKNAFNFVLILYCAIIAPFIIIPRKGWGWEFAFNGRFVCEKNIFFYSNDFLLNLSEGNDFLARISCFVTIKYVCTNLYSSFVLITRREFLEFLRGCNTNRFELKYIACLDLFYRTRVWNCISLCTLRIFE